MVKLPAAIHTNNAPQAIGPYSQGMRTSNMIFTAGQIPINPTTGEMVNGGIEDQTRRACRNLAAVLEAAGSSLDQVLKVTVFMTDLSQFDGMNAVYSEYFVNNPPARSTVQVAGLPMEAQIEIECVALIIE